MTEEQLKVLKFMSEITSRIDLNSFAEMVSLTPNQTIEKVQELVTSGMVKKTGGGYGITEKGKKVLRAITSVSEEMAFNFYTDLGKPTEFSAENIKEFYEIVKRVDANALAFHLYRGDFANWIRGVFEDSVLADKLVSIRDTKIRGEELRKAMMDAIDAEYGFS